MEFDNLQIQQYQPGSLPTARDLAAVFFRQRRAMLITFALVVIAVLVSGIWLPKYEAQMKILVRRQRMDPMVTPQANAPVALSDAVTEEDLNSEVALLNSDDLLRQVVLATGLADHSGSIVSLNDRQARIAMAVRELGKDLTIEPVHKTNVISISYKSRDPHLAQAVLNAVSIAYLEKNLQVHRPNGEFKFFDQQTEQYRRGLQQAEAKLTDFTNKNGVVSAHDEQQMALQRENEFDADASQAKAAAVETRHRIESLRAQLAEMQPRSTTQVRTGENPQLMQQLKSTLLNLQLKKTALLTKFDPSYRPVHEVEKQITDTQAAINAAENRPPEEKTTDQNPTYVLLQSELAKAEAELNGVVARAAAAEGLAKQYDSKAKYLEQSGVKQDDLKRTANTEEQNYLLYVRKREEARISDALDQRGILNVAVAEQPIVPALPVRSIPVTAGLTVMLAFFFSVCTAFVVDFASPLFRTPDELEGCLGVPVLAALPKGKDLPHFQLSAQPFGATPDPDFM